MGIDSNPGRSIGEAWDVVYGDAELWAEVRFSSVEERFEGHLRSVLLLPPDMDSFPVDGE